MKLLLPDLLAPADLDALSPLEQGLRGPDAAQLRARTQAQLQTLEQHVRAAIGAGSLPDHYRELAALLDACLAAQEVLENYFKPPGSPFMRAFKRLN